MTFRTTPVPTGAFWIWATLAPILQFRNVTSSPCCPVLFADTAKRFVAASERSTPSINIFRLFPFGMPSSDVGATPVMDPSNQLNRHEYTFTRLPTTASWISTLMKYTSHDCPAPFGPPAMSPMSTVPDVPANSMMQFSNRTQCVVLTWQSG